MPDAIAMRLGKYSWLSTIVTPKVLTITAPAVHTAIAPTMPAGRDIQQDQPGRQQHAPEEHQPAPQPVGERPRAERADDARQQDERQKRVAVRLGMAARDLPERDEREQAVVGDAAEADQHEQPLERARLVGGRPGTRVCGAAAADVRQVAVLAQEDPADHEAGDDEEEPAVQPERHDCEVREQRPEREADVAPSGEERHAAGSPGAARMTRHLHRLGVKRADAEPRDPDEHKQEGVVRRDRREGNPDPGNHHARGHQPDRASLVRPVAEDGLSHRGCDRRDQHDGGRHRVRQMQDGLQEDQDRGQRALSEIRGQMTK